MNLFGLILVWKRVGERALEKSGVDWTIIRPGGLTEKEDDIQSEGILWTGPDEQQNNSIPRRLVAKSCIEALETPQSIGHIVEITSNSQTKQITLANFLE